MELVVFPRNEYGDYLKDGWNIVPWQVHPKRLTDAELACEAHAAVLDVYRMKVSRRRGRPSKADLAKVDRAVAWVIVTDRFARYPYFDEG